MLLTKRLLKLALLPLLLSYASCVKDIDLDQYEEIVIPPKAAIDLIYFTATSGDFSPGSGNAYSVSDATRLEFLDDDYIQTSLVRADFNFRFTNSFNSGGTAILKFLSQSGNVMHRMEVDIPAGGGPNPAVVDFTEIIDASQIQKIQRSISLSVEVKMQQSPQPENAVLQLESKGLYYFEF